MTTVTWQVKFIWSEGIHKVFIFIFINVYNGHSQQFIYAYIYIYMKQKIRWNGIEVWSNNNHRRVYLMRAIKMHVCEYWILVNEL